MTRPQDAAGREPPETAEPAEALGEIWELLDSLPAAGTSPSMTATTLEMAAVVAAPGPPAAAAGGAAGRWRSFAAWLSLPAVAIVCLVAGAAAGRVTAPQSDRTILALLPVVEQVDLLRELGSEGFLEEVARRGYAPPRRPPPAQSAADVRADAEEFEAAIARLRSWAAEPPGDAELAERRREVLALDGPSRRRLDRSVEGFLRMPPADRRELVVLARSLVHPAHARLLEAARLWHRWVRLRDPADRRDVIELGTAERLECLDRWTRFDGRGEGRNDVVRPWLERDREFRRPPPDDRPGPPPGFRPGPPDFRQGPRDRRLPPEFRRGPPPPHPEPREPPVSDPQPPPETEAPPR